MNQELEELTIYHLYRLRTYHGFLIGIKVGCTNNLEHRTQENKKKYGDDCFVEVLETFIGTHEQGTEREFFWTDYFGYPRGVPYHLAREQRQKMQAASVASPNASFKNPTHLKKMQAALAASPNAIWKDPENIKKLHESNRLSPNAIWKDPNHIKKMSEASIESRKHNCNLIVVCPHCGVEGKNRIMKRWHFDRCKSKLEQKDEI